MRRDGAARFAGSMASELTAMLASRSLVGFQLALVYY